MSQLTQLRTNTPDNRLMAHRDAANGFYGQGGAWIVMVSLDAPAPKGGVKVSLSVEDPEKAAKFTSATVTIPYNTQEKAVILLTPTCKAEHTVTLKAKCDGVELSKVVTVFP